MDMTSHHLFVYGSLRSGFRNPVYEYLTRYFSCVGEAVVKGKFFEKGTFPVAVAAEDAHFIEGELYSMHSPQEFSWAFEQLDDYEGLNTEHGIAPFIQKRTRRSVSGGRNYSCMDLLVQRRCKWLKRN